jgi:hypothetical protein
MSSISVFHKQHGESQNKMRQVLRLLRDSGLLTRSVSHYTHSIVIHSSITYRMDLEMHIVI